MAKAELYDGSADLATLYSQVEYSRADAKSLGLEMVAFYLDMACLELGELLREGSPIKSTETNGQLSEAR